MRKVQFFILIETLLFTMAVFDVLANEGARIILFLAFLLLVIRQLLKSKGVDFFLVSALLLFLLVFILDTYFIIGVFLAVIYSIINSFSRYEKRNQYTRLVLDDEQLEAKRHKTKWLGNETHTKDHYGFEDINVIRLFGNDIIDLDQAALVGRDNIVMIRKVFGKTKIIVPIDVEVSLSVTSLYGRVEFLGLSYWDLRNESFSITSPHYKTSHKRVKLVVNGLLGDVEVIRV